MSLAASGAAGRAPDTQGFIRDVAGRLDVSPGALTAAVRAALDDRIDAAVADGRLSAARGAALKEHLAERATVPILAARRLRRVALVAGARVAAAYLGISVSALRSELASGQTLARIASSTAGRSTSGLQAALLAAGSARLERAGADERITSAQAQRQLTRLAGRLPALLRRSWTAPLGRHGPRRLRRVV